MENNKDAKTRTLIRIAASFDDGGNAVAAVDFYGETDPCKQLELLGILVFEVFAKTDAHAKDIFSGKPKAFPGSKSKLNACLSADGKAYVFPDGTEKGTSGELLRCAVDGWLEKNPQHTADDVAQVGIRHIEKRCPEIKTPSAFASRVLSEIIVAGGKALPRLVRAITALRILVSIFVKG